MMSKWFVCLIGCILCLALGAAGHHVHQKLRVHRNEHQVFVGCHSDRIFLIAGPLESYARDHDGNLPDPGAIPALMPGDRGVPRCYNGERGFIFNRSLAQINVREHNSRLLAWCPVGSHGEFVATLFLRDGHIMAEVTSLKELASALERELRPEPTQPDNRDPSAPN